jgi:hypothetical protein
MGFIVLLQSCSFAAKSIAGFRFSRNHAIRQGNFNAKAQKRKDTARQAATKDELAAKEHKDHKKTKNVSSCLCVPCFRGNNFVKNAKLFRIALQ